MLLCGLTDKDLRRICGSQYEHPDSAIGYWPETCLGHVYIVLEPVGSARLTLRWQFYWVLMYRRSSESRMRSGIWRGVSKWSRRKNRYIGRLYSDFGTVPSDSGIFRSTGELREFVLGLNGPYGKGEKGLKRWPHPSPWSGPNWTRGAAPLSFSLSGMPPAPVSKGARGRLPAKGRGAP